MAPHTKKGNQRHWTVKIYDAKDQLHTEETCSTLTEVAQIFGLSRACDMSHFLYVPKDAAKRLMLQRWNVWFTVERAPAQLPEALLRVLKSVPT